MTLPSELQTILFPVVCACMYLFAVRSNIRDKGLCQLIKKNYYFVAKATLSLSNFSTIANQLYTLFRRKDRIN